MSFGTQCHVGRCFAALNMANAYVFGTRGRTPTLGCDVPPCLTASRVHRRLLPDTCGSTRPVVAWSSACVRGGGADRDRDRLPVPVGRGPLGQHDLPGQAAYHIMMRINHVPGSAGATLRACPHRYVTSDHATWALARVATQWLVLRFFCHSGMRVGGREQRARSLRNAGIVSRVSSGFGAEY